MGIREISAFLQLSVYFAAKCYKHHQFINQSMCGQGACPSPPLPLSLPSLHISPCHFFSFFFRDDLDSLSKSSKGRQSLTYNLFSLILMPSLACLCSLRDTSKGLSTPLDPSLCVILPFAALTSSSACPTHGLCSEISSHKSKWGKPPRACGYMGSVQQCRCTLGDSPTSRPRGPFIVRISRSMGACTPHLCSDPIIY